MALALSGEPVDHLQGLAIVSGTVTRLSRDVSRHL